VIVDTQDETYRLAETAENACEGCQHCLFAGIRWPASPDGSTDRSFVDRCDVCEIYSSDDEAVKALASHFGVRWGWADRYNPEGEVRWEPPEDDGLDYTGFSAFIEHDARDGDPQYYRGGYHQALNLNPGAARVLLDALSDKRVSITAEWLDNEVWAVVLANSLGQLADEIQRGLTHE
jgi:hypothetical protein